MSTKDAAAFLGITSRTVYRLIDEGELPAYKVGRIRRADADAFLDAHRVQPGSLKHLYPSGPDDDGIDGMPDEFKPKRRLPGERA